MVTLETILKCAQEDETAQRQLFDTYGDRLFKIAFRYIDDKMEAEDVIISVFVKVFSAIKKSSFESVKRFEAWLRKIVVNESLSVLRKKHRFRIVELGDIKKMAYSDSSILDELSVKEILELISKLPTGYRTVLNLYAIEGYNHLEISELLGISVGASKSQLSKARAHLKRKINKLDNYG